MEHNLVNPNQPSSYIITVQDNPFSIDPVLISTEDHEFSLLLVRTVIVLGFSTRAPTDREIHNFSHIILLSEHEWDAHNAHFPTASHTEENNISRTVRYIMTQGEDFNFLVKYNNDPENQSLY